MSTLSPAGESVRTRMSRAGRDRAPAVLVDAVLAYEVPEEDLPRLLADAWCGAEHPLRVEEPTVWRVAFSRVGYRTAGGQLADRPARMVLYRGASRTEATGRFGWSWTTDLLTAKYFATRHGQEGTAVYRAEVPGAALLADYRDDDRGEGEVVVDPDLLDPATVEIVAIP